MPRFQRLPEFEFDAAVLHRAAKRKAEFTLRGKTITDILNMPVEEGVGFFAAEPAISKKIEVLNDLGLGYLTLGQSATTLSGGEARRLSVATALATAPRLLILDEPTFGQDRRTWLELVTLLSTLRNEGHAVIAVTHDDAFVTTLADRTFPLGIVRLADSPPLPRRRRA